MTPAIVGPRLGALAPHPCRNGGSRLSICRPCLPIAALFEAAAIYLGPASLDRAGNVLECGVVCVLVGCREERGAQPKQVGGELVVIQILQ